MSPTLVMFVVFGCYFFVGIFPALKVVFFARQVCHAQYLCRSSFYYCSLFLVSIIGWPHFIRIIHSDRVRSDIAEFVITEPYIWRWLLTA
ncbi:MAG: hypothetical protein RIQ54_563 [Candidatus Parcubacteria bacterium]